MTPEPADSRLAITHIRDEDRIALEFRSPELPYGGLEIPLEPEQVEQLIKNLELGLDQLDRGAAP